MMPMLPVLSADAMRAADRFTIEEFGIPGFTLMESAGRGAAQMIDRHLGPVTGRSVHIYCGKGNNGGDGFVVARYLFDRGARIRVILLRRDLEDCDTLNDAGAHLHLLRKLDGMDPDGRLSVMPFSEISALEPADIHVDALLGTGTSSELREPIRSIVTWLNQQPGRKVALDIPTGLHADTGRILGVAFRAEWTFTMGAPKTGLYMGEGKTMAGRVEVVDIGIPHGTLRAPVENGTHGCAWLTSDEAVRRSLPQRAQDANKYSVGLALVVAGTEGMTGAPVMASGAAARVGAGYVICGCDSRIQSVLSTKLTEVTTIPLPATEAGIDPEGAMDALKARLEKAQGVLIGCGLGQAPDTQAFVRRFLSETDLPLVVDADGLNALVGYVDLIRNHARGRWILTPHMGEFRRLAGEDLGKLDENSRLALAQRYAAAWNCVLLVKGLPSVVAAPDGRAWISSAGGTELASAGTGDVLAGMCAGFLAQGMEPLDAAIAGLHVGGAAAEHYAARYAGRSLQATDLVDQLPAVLKSRFHAV